MMGKKEYGRMANANSLTNPLNSLPKIERLPMEGRKEQPEEPVATSSISGM